MNIFLMGYMGSGKSTTGKLLAKRLNKPFADLDELIEKEENIQIEHFFEEQGEVKFRELEHKYLRQIVGKTNMVVSLGGGTPCYGDNLALIKNNGISVYLKMSAAALANRLINGKKNRPLIKNIAKEELLAHVERSLAVRENFYLQADFILNGINLNVEELIKTISTDLF